MKLIKKSIIEIGAGCEAYQQGKIIFTPKKSIIEVKFDNFGNYFNYYENDQFFKVNNFSIKINKDIINSFFNNIIKISKNPKKTNKISTRGAAVKLNLIFDSTKINTILKEFDGIEMNPLLDEINKLFLYCFKNSKQYEKVNKSFKPKVILSKEQALEISKNIYKNQNWNIKDMKISENPKAWIIKSKDVKDIIINKDGSSIKVDF